MQVKLKTEDELKDMAAKLLHISVNLRHWTKEWNEKHGGLLLQRKKFWENKMDEYLEELKTEKTHTENSIHISINNENK